MQSDKLRRRISRWFPLVATTVCLGLFASGCGSVVPGSTSRRLLPTFGEANTNSRAFKKKVEADTSIPKAEEVFGMAVAADQ